MLIKRLCQTVAFVWVLPRLVVYRLASVVLGRDRAFANASEGVGRVPGMRGVYLRQAFYRSTLETFSTPRATIGEGVYIGRRCGLGFVVLGDRAMLADGVQVLSGGRQHGLDAEGAYLDQPQEFRRVEIGAGAWLGAATTVMADIGERAVIGAGAVVTRPIESGALAVGVPARSARRAGNASGEA
jgi:acetyltransferase-like isoleucine patch superfamily enzyme